jgi:large subunit ribosomal protein L25
MSDDVSIKLKKREILGKGLGRLRAQGLVPAVVHDHGQPSLHVMGSDQALLRSFAKVGKHQPIQLEIGNQRRLALIKDADFEPTKRRLRHVVFQSIKQDEKVSAEVPVVLIGQEIPAEKKSLLVLSQLDTVEIEALPKDLPDRLEVDATTLAEVGDRLQVSDIKSPPGVDLLSDPELVIAVVEMPKDQAAEANAAAAEMAAEKAATVDTEATAQDGEITDGDAKTRPTE